MRRIHLIFIILIGCTENNYVLYESLDDTETDTAITAGTETDTETDTAITAGTETDTETCSDTLEIIAGTAPLSETDSDTDGDTESDAEPESCVDSDDKRLGAVFELVHANAAVRGNMMYCQITQGDDLYHYIMSGSSDSLEGTMTCSIYSCFSNDGCMCENPIEW